MEFSSSMFRCALVLYPILILSAKTAEWDRAKVLVQKGDYKQAVSVLEKVSDKDADNLQLLGEAWVGLKDYKKAVDVLEEAAERDPKSSNIQLWLGRAWGHRAEGNKLMALSWARNAKNAFEKAVALDGKNRDALDDLLEYYVEAPGIVGGGLDKAEGVAKQIAALDPAAGRRAMDKIARARKN